MVADGAVPETVAISSTAVTKQQLQHISSPKPDVQRPKIVQIISDAGQDRTSISPESKNDSDTDASKLSERSVTKKLSEESDEIIVETKRRSTTRDLEKRSRSRSRSRSR